MGATLLSSLSTEDAAPLMAGILMAIGTYVLLRFSLGTPLTSGPWHQPQCEVPGAAGSVRRVHRRFRWWWLGSRDTSTLLSQGKTAPRTVIGSVSASEFLVALSASLGFLIGLRHEFLENWPVVVGLMVGGVIAAPFAAWLVSRVSPALLGTAVGGVIVLTNSQKLVHFFDIQWPWSTAIYTLIVVAWVSLVVYAWRVSRARSSLPMRSRNRLRTKP